MPTIVEGTDGARIFRPLGIRSRRRRSASGRVIGSRWQRTRMKTLTTICLACVGPGGLVAPQLVSAQEAVVAAPDVDALFTDKDPKLQANKQVAYHIMRDLLGAGQWDKAVLYLTERYIQHNPNAPSGRTAIVKFFTGFGMKPRPVPAHLNAPVVQVLAQGDYVIVASVATLPNSGNPGTSYTTTWFDMWRIKDGKADEHWDSATLMPMPGK